eukprot:maker-scaffold922_size80897-snap-gene-0.25 protein:Tk09261 transcript:maker-scaffold922_size80897-snap-gene-0.25-mRNA-1 annotation:"GL23993"
MATAGQLPQQYCLRWNNHQHNLLSVFEDLLNSEAFVDVTLACEGLQLKAHKMVLSACSPYFQAMLYNTPDRHPIVFLRDVRYEEMKALLEFMYRGEVSVDQENLSSLLKVAEGLKIKGLAEVNDNGPAPSTTHSKFPLLSPNPMDSLSSPTKRIPTPPNNPAPSLGCQSSQANNSGALGPKRKRARPRRFSGSEAVPMAGGFSHHRLDQPLEVQTEDMSEGVKADKGLREGNGEASPRDAKALDLMSEADSNDGRSSVHAQLANNPNLIRQLPKKRLFMDRNSTGSAEYDRESTAGSPGGSSNDGGGGSGSVTSGSSFQLPNSTTECEQPENLSLKREDLIGRVSVDSNPAGFSEATVVPKVDDGISMKKFWEERLANGLYGQGGLCDAANPPTHKAKSLSASAALLTAAASAADALPQDAPVMAANNYLASFQFHAEAELAALYNAATASNSPNGSPSKGSKSSPGADANNPISIRSFCIQEGNTYRCKVCNNAYTHPSNFHRHYVTTHLNRKSYPCTVCSKKFNRKDNMTAHLRAVHGWGGSTGSAGPPESPATPPTSISPHPTIKEVEKSSDSFDETPRASAAIVVMN